MTHRLKSVAPVKFYSILICLVSLFALSGVIQAKDPAVYAQDSVVDSLIVLDSCTYADGISLAWSYPGVAGIDYKKMLSDADYATQIDHQYNPYDHPTVRNYLTNAQGIILAILPVEFPEQGNWDVLTRAAPGSFDFGNRSYNIYDSYDAGSTLVTKENEWATFEIYFYKRISDGPNDPVVALTFVPDINIDQITALYLRYLNAQYSNDPEYIKARDKRWIEITVSIKSPLSKKSLPEEVDYAYLVHLNAQVIKGHAGWGGDDTDKFVGIKVSSDNKHSDFSILRLEVDHLEK